MLTAVNSFTKTHYGLVAHPTIHSRNNGFVVSSERCAVGLYTDVMCNAKESHGSQKAGLSEK